MTEDIKIELDAELPPGRVPFSLDADTAVRLGRRHRTRRRLIAGGGSALSVVAAVGLLVAGLTPGAPSGSDDPAGQETTQAWHDDFPELDPDRDHWWAGEGFSRNDPPKPVDDYTASFWNHMRTALPQARMYELTHDTGDWRVPDGDVGDVGYFRLEEQSLYQGDIQDPEDHEAMGVDRDTYSLVQWDDSPEAGGLQDSLTMRFTDDATTEDHLGVYVLPAGTYRMDSGDIYDPAACGTSHMEFDACDAERAEGPDGQDLRNVSLKVDTDFASRLEIERSVVYYRFDGSVVIVSDASIRSKESEPGPYLSYEQLAQIAFALPRTPVE